LHRQLVLLCTRDLQRRGLQVIHHFFSLLIIFLFTKPPRGHLGSWNHYIWAFNWPFAFLFRLVKFHYFLFKIYFYSVSETIEQITKKPLEFPEISISSLAKDFIKRLLNRNYEQRISASEALLHPFLSPYINKTPPQSTRKLFGPKIGKKYLTLTHQIPKEFLSAHKMTMNFRGNNDLDFKIMRLESSYDCYY